MCKSDINYDTLLCLFCFSCSVNIILFNILGLVASVIGRQGIRWSTHDLSEGCEETCVQSETATPEIFL